MYLAAPSFTLTPFPFPKFICAGYTPIVFCVPTNLYVSSGPRAVNCAGKTISFVSLGIKLTRSNLNDFCAIDCTLLATSNTETSIIDLGLNINLVLYYNYKIIVLKKKLLFCYLIAQSEFLYQHIESTE